MKLPTFDTSTHSSGTGTTLTFPHVIGSGGNRVLIVAVANFSDNNITDVTYNGVSMTFEGQSRVPGQNYWVSVYSLKNPPTGSHNIVVTDLFSALMYATSASWFDVNQTTPINISGGITGTGVNSIAKSLTTTVDNCLLVAAVQATAGTLSAGSGTTMRQTSNSSNFSLFDSNTGITPAGSGTLNINIDSTRDVAMFMIALAPSSVSITKSLAYAVKVTKAAVTKSLKYCVKKTPAAKTKSLQYAVKKTPAAMTKSVKYVVVLRSTLTKTLSYRVQQANLRIKIRKTLSIVYHKVISYINKFDDETDGYEDQITNPTDSYQDRVDAPTDTYQGQLTDPTDGYEDTYDPETDPYIDKYQQ